MSDLITYADLDRLKALANCQDKAEIFVVINAAPAADAEPVRHDVGRCYDCKHYVIWGIRQNSDVSAEEIRYCDWWNPTGNPYRKPHPDGFCSNMERRIGND